MKKCPRDGTVLAMTRVEGIVLDKCHNCDGIWCDHGELEAMKKAKLTGVEELLEHSYGDPVVRVAKKDGPMRCPACEGRLIAQTFAVHLPMRVDRCDTCFGIWLDEGELDAALGKPRKQKPEEQVTPIMKVLKSVSQWLN